MSKINNSFKHFFDNKKIKKVRFENGIPKFSPNFSYSTGNFSLLRSKHSLLQFDSINNTNHRLETILSRTNWNIDFFKDKFILECGCGAGPDTEILLKLGAKVVSVDIAGLEIAKSNINNNKNHLFVQASLLDLPFNKDSFDIIFCHRVIQHTPDPKRILKKILNYVKPNGNVFIHSYSRSKFQMFRWKYFLRPITKKLPPNYLYKKIVKNSNFLFRVTNLFYKLGKVGKALNHFFIPFLNYRNIKNFKNKSDKWIIEYGIHDTFDALSPKYDSPLSKRSFRNISDQILKDKNIKYEIFSNKSITLLRSILKK
tara:strand:+ start:2829 stop:3767 length:939 start_codon:yes stop_codon:yes gene_type:complete